MILAEAPEDTCFLTFDDEQQKSVSDAWLAPVVSRRKASEKRTANQRILWANRWKNVVLEVIDELPSTNRTLAAEAGRLQCAFLQSAGCRQADCRRGPSRESMGFSGPATSVSLVLRPI